MTDTPRKPPNWSAAELEALEDIATNQPSDLLTRRYNHWAAQNGYVQRTEHALRTKCSRRGIVCRPVGEWVSAGFVRDVLGIGNDTPQRWTERQWVTAHRDPRGRRTFRRTDLIRMAKERPAAFGGINPDRLFLLLEDRRLCNHIAKRFPRRAMDPRPVRAIETGWHYPSVRAAAARVYITRQAIQEAIRTGGTAAGYHWSYV